jgi:hypothetical protein
MKYSFGLNDLVSSLKYSHLTIDLVFLNKLLKNASKSENPHREKIFAKLINCPMNENKKSATTIYGWMQGYRTIPLSKLAEIIKLSNFSWYDLEKNVLSIKAGIRNGEINPKFPVIIDYRLGSIIGHILGDGSIDKRFHSVFYSNSNIELLKEFSENMKYIFGVNPRIWVQDKPKYGETKWLKKLENFEGVPNGNNVGLFYPKICSDILYAIIGVFAEGKNKIITSQIKNSDINFKRGLIRAFFDDEGSVNSKSYTIRFHQDRKDILEDIIFMLNELDIKPKKVRSYFKNGKLRYYFNITSFEEYSKFYNLIGCTSSKKQKEFEFLINKVKNKY